jgi:hypothetical protein
MDEKLKNLSLDNANNVINNFNNIVPGSIIKIKNKENEYIVLGYDQYRTNLVCVDYNDKYQTDKFYLVDNSNLESVTKYNELPKLTRFVYE